MEDSSSRQGLNNKKKIELVFPESDVDIENRPVRRGPSGNMLHRFAANLDDITSWFDQYEIESIEVSISGGVETGGILKLAVNAKGEGGLKLKLKPRIQKAAVQN